jgi:hypothetical protein
MKYILIETDNIETFIIEVYTKLNLGFKIHGNIFTYQKNGKTINSLAVVKDEQITEKTPVLNKTIAEILASWNC